MIDRRKLFESSLKHTITDTGTFDTEFSLAVETITKAIRESPELYFGYQSNIAMMMHDSIKECLEQGCEVAGDNIKVVCNDGAKRFLDMWIKERN